MPRPGLHCLSPTLSRHSRSPITHFTTRLSWLPTAAAFALYRKKINLSSSLAGQAVGVKEVDDGIWLVSFMNYDLGYIDLEEKTLQPLENPFGAKV